MATLPTEQQTNTQIVEPKSVFTVKELKHFAFDLNERIEHTRVKKVAGFDRYKRSVSKELTKLQEKKNENELYSSTNIFYLTALWNYCMEIGLSNVNALCKKIKYDDDLHDTKRAIIVDVVCHAGLKWVKIKSKNPYSIQVDILKSDIKSNILTVADRYIAAAKCNKIKFKIPKIEFIFTKGITCDVLYMLKTKGIKITGNEIKESIFFEDDDEDENDENKDDDDNEMNVDTKNDDNEIDETAVNLGPKTMMTMISACSNNELHSEFWEVVENYVIEREDNKKGFRSTIYQQALNFSYNMKVAHKLFSSKSTQMLSNMVSYYYEEIQYPVIPVIMNSIGTKKLCCCQSAWDSVTKLVSMGAGPNEFSRYQQLAQQITIIPDNISKRTQKLSGKGISKINKAVFGTGDELRMLTVAGVPTFVRKARQKGIDFYCKIHDVRPFIEQYQIGFEIFKLNKGFDYNELKTKMNEEEIDLNFADDDSDDDSDDDDDEEEDDDDDDNEDDDREFIEMQEDFENFNTKF